MNIFQHLVLSILFINKHIFGEHNSDISLPLPFSCQQLAKQVHLGSKFSLLNVPSQAVTYWVHGKNYKKGDGGNCPCNDTIRVSALKDDSDELYVTLEKKQNEICATRQLIKLKGDHRCTNEDLAKYSHKTHDYRSNGFSERGVVFNVDWQKRCELIVGSKQVFKCNHGGDENSTIQWYQEFNHGNANPVPIGDRSTVTMRIDDLDENTAFVCYQKVGQFGKSKEIVRYPIKISTLNSSRIIPRYYNETSEIRYSCEKNPEHEGYTLVMLIQNKVFKNVTQYSGPVQLKLKEEDSGSIFSCVNIIQKPLEIERNISKKEMFIFKREPHVRDLSTTTRHVTKTSFQVTTTPEPEPVSLKVGEEKVLKCSHNDSYSSTRMAWHHYFPKGNETLYYPTITDVKTYKFELTLEEFDDDTVFTCVMSQNPLNNQTHVTKLSVINSTADVSHINEKYYDEETILEFNCSQFASFYYLLLVKPDKYISIFSHEKGTKMKFTKSDNKSILYCLYIVPENEIHYKKVTRHVKKIALLIYQEKKEENFKTYFFIGGAITGTIVLSIISILFWKCCNKSKKSASDNYNEDTGRLTYAELDLSHVPINNQKPRVEETPYAEIIRCENKPYLDYQITPENTESPYANC